MAPDAPCQQCRAVTEWQLWPSCCRKSTGTYTQGWQSLWPRLGSYCQTRDWGRALEEGVLCMVSLTSYNSPGSLAILVHVSD